MSVHALRVTAPLRVLDGFGRSVRAACRHAAPRSVDELAELLVRARREGLGVTFRGSGRSYGDAALNERGIVVDTTALCRLLRWEPSTGVLEAEAGLTIEGLWRRTIEDGFWPAVVPGTMHPTLGGCLSTNVHGKNNWRAGTFGDHVLGFDLLTSDGDVLRCSREEHGEVFRAAIGGLGLLGAITRVRLKLHRVHSGRLEVVARVGANLERTFDLFEEHLAQADYVVGWIDALARGRALGRSVIHAARYLEPGEDPEGRASLHVEAQGLPSSILGVPRGLVARVMRPAVNDVGCALVNLAKYGVARARDGERYLQSHVAFAFLLDYVPEWRSAYGRRGFVQIQAFVPRARARRTFRLLLERTHGHRLPSYLAVLKRHRPDAFLLSHGLDGWSLALDVRVPSERRDLIALADDLAELVLDAGGTFYMAKDALLRSEDVARAYGARLATFGALRERIDPSGLFESDLARRLALRHGARG